MMPTSEIFKEELSFNNKFKWYLFSEKLPTEIKGEQVDILYADPRWATYIRGMYTHWPEESLTERLSQYDVANDKFYVWDSMMPTHWFPLPENPKLK